MAALRQRRAGVYGVGKPTFLWAMSAVVGMLFWPAPAAVAVEREVLFDGTGAAAWDTSRDAARLESEFALSRVIQATNPPALLWRFVPKNVQFNDLFLMKPIERPFTAIRVEIRNEGAAFEFAAKTRDADGAEWTTERVALPAHSDWRWVDFPLPQWHVASWSADADGRLDFPLSAFTIIAFGVTRGAEYQIRVARVEVIRPDPPVAVVERAALPRRVRAGGNYPVRIVYRLSRVCTEPSAALVFKQNGRVLFTLPLRGVDVRSVEHAGRTAVVNCRIAIPLYAFGGDYQVSLKLGEARIAGAGGKPMSILGTISVHPRIPGRTVATVKLYHGTPTLMINGKPYNGMAWATYSPSQAVFKDFARAGVQLYTFAATPTESGYGLSRTAWVAPDRYDFSQLDERAMMLLQANPHAYFFPRLYLHAPKWWSDAHPNDIVLMDPGDGKPVPFIHAGGKPAPSWASEAWRNATLEGLRKLIEHIEASPYADRVIGYHIASGTTEEWMMWGANENEWVDYSPVNEAGFRRWLRRKYRTDAGLQNGWHRKDVTLATAEIPTKAQRQAASLGALQDPAKNQAVIDYNLYTSDLVADTILTFARGIKQMTHGEKIVGAFYGYLLQLCGEQRQQNAGHLALKKVLNSPYIDFLCSPTSYAFRELGGEGTSHFMSLFGSVKLHGKLWFDENDIRTSLSGGAVGLWGRPPNVEGDILQQEKELADVLTNGAAQWWFDVGGNRYDAPRLMACIKGLVKAASAVQTVDRSPADEVALIVDERSLAYLRVGDPMGYALLLGQIPALARIGAPVGHYLVSDLPKLPGHKLYLIPTSIAPTEEDRRAVERLKRDGHVLVFVWAPGLYRDNRLDDSAMAQFTGIALRMERPGERLRVKLKSGEGLAAGLEPTEYGVDYPVAPSFYADDAQAEVLGTLPDGRPGLVIKRYPTWTAVYSAAPMLPTSLLVRLAELAGVHRYISTPDVVWATKQVLAVCVRDSGPREIRLRHPASSVVDLYTGREVADGVRTFTANFGKLATRVFLLR
ncbi:MAG: beta-galactosidase [Chthonomonadales bacterium]